MKLEYTTFDRSSQKIRAHHLGVGYWGAEVLGMGGYMTCKDMA